jgi:hypothetical protein
MKVRQKASLGLQPSPHRRYLPTNRNLSSHVHTFIIYNHVSCLCYSKELVGFLQIDGTRHNTKIELYMLVIKRFGLEKNMKYDTQSYAAYMCVPQSHKLDGRMSSKEKNCMPKIFHEA